MGRKPNITIERVYSDDPADWEAVAEELAKILIRRLFSCHLSQTPNVLKLG